MFVRIMTLAWLLLTGLGTSLGKDVPDSRDLVIGAGADAVRVRIVMRIDGETLESRRQQVLASVVQMADENGDGTLSKPEWRRALALVGDPMAGMAMQGGAEVDAATRTLAAHLGEPLEFVEQPRPLVDRLELFEALDADGDRELTQEEFAEAPALMGWYDADGDGTLDMPELAPTEPLQPMPLTTSSDLPAGRYPFSWEPSSGKPDVLVELKLISQAFGKPKIEASVVEGSAANRVAITPERRSVELKVGDLSLVLDARAGLISPEDVKRFFLLQMRQRDADKNGYLNESEFVGLALPSLSFDMADADGNGMLFADELREKLDGLIARETNRLRIEVSYEREALFTRLDTDGDDRLSRRELLAADGNSGTGQAETIAIEDFGGQYRLEFGVPNLLDEANPQMRADVTAMARERMDRTGAGPSWFRAMDRNADGDLAQREFLGDGERFAAMDADGNGLIAVDEIGDEAAAASIAVDGAVKE